MAQSSRAHGVVVSHPLRMRKALGSNPSVSITFARGGLTMLSGTAPLHVPRSKARSISNALAVALESLTV